MYYTKEMLVEDNLLAFPIKIYLFFVFNIRLFTDDDFFY
jgi:hypothetical protein